MSYKKEIKKEINNEYYNEQLKMRREYKTISTTMKMRYKKAKIMIQKSAKKKYIRVYQ